MAAINCDGTDKHEAKAEHADKPAVILCKSAEESYLCELHDAGLQLEAISDWHFEGHGCQGPAARHRGQRALFTTMPTVAA